VATCHLFCSKYGLEISEVHTTLTNFEQGADDSRSLTMPCMVYCPMTPGK